MPTWKGPCPQCGKEIELTYHTPDTKVGIPGQGQETKKKGGKIKFNIKGILAVVIIVIIFGVIVARNNRDRENGSVAAVRSQKISSQKDYENKKKGLQVHNEDALLIQTNNQARDNIIVLQPGSSVPLKLEKGKIYSINGQLVADTDGDNVIDAIY